MNARIEVLAAPVSPRLPSGEAVVQRRVISPTSLPGLLRTQALDLSDPTCEAGVLRARPLASRACVEGTHRLATRAAS
jgi:hypothetical protein